MHTLEFYVVKYDEDGVLEGKDDAEVESLRMRYQRDEILMILDSDSQHMFCLYTAFVVEIYSVTKLSTINNVINQKCTSARGVSKQLLTLLM